MPQPQDALRMFETSFAKFSQKAKPATLHTGTSRMWLAFRTAPDCPAPGLRLGPRAPRRKTTQYVKNDSTGERGGAPPESGFVGLLLRHQLPVSRFYQWTSSDFAVGRSVHLHCGSPIAGCCDESTAPSEKMLPCMLAMMVLPLTQYALNRRLDADDCV